MCLQMDLWIRCKILESAKNIYFRLVLSDNPLIKHYNDLEIRIFVVIDDISNIIFTTNLIIRFLVNLVKTVLP